jgi:hypothetical protein
MNRSTSIDRAEINRQNAVNALRHGLSGQTVVSPRMIWTPIKSTAPSFTPSSSLRVCSNPNASRLYEHRPIAPSKGPSNTPQ